MLDDLETATNGVYAARSRSNLKAKQGWGKIVNTLIPPNSNLEVMFCLRL